MNIRKKTDYSALYQALDTAMTANLPQMELYSAIGKAVSLRPEKGAAVAAAEYMAEHYPDAHGFSPRNVRRMRDFYRTYENSSQAMKAAMEIGWTQNVVILEADLSMELRAWYLRAVKKFGWSKAELTEKITANAHEKIVLAMDDDMYNILKRCNQAIRHKRRMIFTAVKNRALIRRFLKSTKKEDRRRWCCLIGLLFQMLSRLFQIDIPLFKSCPKFVNIFPFAVNSAYIFSV